MDAQLAVGDEQWVETGGVRITKTRPPLGFEVSEKNWSRWGAHLKGLRDPIPFTKDVMVLCFGLIPSSVLALVAWLPNYSQLPAKAQSDYWWVTPIMLAVALSALVIALVMGLTRAEVDKRVKRDADLLWDDMNHSHPFSQAKPQSPERSTHE